MLFGGLGEVVIVLRDSDGAGFRNGDGDVGEDAFGEREGAKFGQRVAMKHSKCSLGLLLGHLFLTLSLTPSDDMVVTTAHCPLALGEGSRVPSSLSEAPVLVCLSPSLPPSNSSALAQSEG